MSDGAHDPAELPADLPEPVDDGACGHLVGMRLPKITLASTSGRRVALDELGSGAVAIYCYPRTGRPGVEPLGGVQFWNALPGARGCTPQACAYRDAYAALQAVGLRVYGLSSQTPAYQREMVERLHLPFEVLSDAELRLARTLRLPTFAVAGQQLIKRLTLLVEDGVIAACHYPVFPPDADAGRVLTWARARRSAAPA